MTKHWIALALMFSAIPRPALAHDCDGVLRRKVIPADWPVLYLYIQNFFYRNTAIRFLQSIEYGEWLIIQVDTTGGGDDPPFVFFRGRPDHLRVVWEYSGIDPDLMDQAIAAAPGIPRPVARCFAWSVGHVD